MVIIRKAKISDAYKIKKIIDFYARREIMLFRPIYAIYSNIRDYFVAQLNRKVVGCCALHILGKEYRPGRRESVLAEIKSLAILEKYQGKRIGTRLAKKCIREAKKMEINKIFTLTIEENVGFFKKLGFKEIKKTELPQKIWQECADCPRFPSDCNEVSLILKI
ncbi:N-acetyltransferase [Candidatus Microgenomates bacterium]|nr:N-acetyltransferase [Candidatus Microgenomates bacterium]